ncbi:MAG: AAA family ATPase [Muribaculaceae bacterium]
MKFKKLEIKNIASIESAVIDFESSPLSESGVFLICGDTGAGKTTILDSICLAMFNTTPRGRNAKGSDSTLNDIKLKDGRQHLRRGCVEGIIRLLITGLDDREYELKWRAYRAHKKPEGKIQTVERYMSCTETGEVYKNDINEDVKRVTGLDFEQFCRTTMLAQGEFTVFLKSEDDKKAEILEKLTSTTDYAAIGKKVYEIRKQKEEDVRLLESQKGALTVFTDEELAEKREKLSELEVSLRQSEEERGELQQKRQWIEREREATAAKHRAQAEYDKAKDTMESVEIKSAKTVCDQWEQTVQVRANFGKINEAETVISDETATMERLEGKFQRLLSGMNYIESKNAQDKEMVERLSSEKEAEKDKAEIYANTQAISEKIGSIFSAEKAVKDIKAEIEKEQKRQETVLRRKVAECSQSVSEATAGYEAKKAEIDKINACLEDIDMDKVYELCDKSEAREKVLKEVLELIESESKQRGELEEKRSREAEQRESARAKKGEIRNLGIEIYAQKFTLETLKAALDGLNDSVDSWAKNIRRKLKVGDTCPVCRRVIEEEINEEEIDKLFETNSSVYKEKEAELKEMEGRKAKLEAEVEVIEKDCDRLAKEIAEGEKHLQETVEKIEGSVRMHLGVEKCDEAVKTSVAAQYSKLTEERKKLEKSRKEIEKYQKQSMKLSKELGVLKTKQEQAVEAKNAAEKAVSNSETSIKGYEEQIARRNAEREAKISEVTAMVSCCEAFTGWQSDMIGFGAELKRKAENYRKLEEKIEKLNGEISKEQSVIDTLNVTIKHIYESVPQWRAIVATGSEEMTNTGAIANEVLSASSASIAKRQRAEAAIKTAKAEIEAYVSENTEYTEELLSLLNAISASEISEKKAKIEHNVKLLAEKSGALKSATELLAEVFKNRPEIEEGETYESISEAEGKKKIQAEEIAMKVGELRKTISADSENRMKVSSLLAELEEKQKVLESWSKIDSLIGSADGKKFRTIAQSFILSSLVESANQYLSRLSDRYRLYVLPGSFVMYVIDGYEGGVKRPVSTISGGESFLVSLSLALALSGVGRNICFDTMFIDEGFGTLSDAVLDGAITTLRHLHSMSGRHVGIISHVEKLRNEIPVQIQVKRNRISPCSTVEVKDVSVEDRE